MTERAPFPLVVGCGRSGTTLLRAMCDAHPDLAVPAEAPFVVALAGEPFSVPAFLHRLRSDERFALWELPPGALEAALDRDPRPATYADAVRRTYATYAAAHGKRRYVDKTPANVLHLPLLTTLFPEAVVVHLVRDGRDVAASFVELGWARSVEEAALHWRLRVRRGRAAGAQLGERYLEVRYEDLVADPEPVLRRVCALAELPYDPAVLDPTRTAAAVTRTTTHPGYHRHLVRPPTPGLRDWRTQLSDDAVTRIELIAGDLLDELGYPRSGVSPSLRTRAAVGLTRARWQLHRLRRRLRRPPR